MACHILYLYRYHTHLSPWNQIIQIGVKMMIFFTGLEAWRYGILMAAKMVAASFWTSKQQGKNLGKSDREMAVAFGWSTKCCCHFTSGCERVNNVATIEWLKACCLACSHFSWRWLWKNLFLSAFCLLKTRGMSYLAGCGIQENIICSLLCASFNILLIISAVHWALRFDWQCYDDVREIV